MAEHGDPIQQALHSCPTTDAARDREGEGVPPGDAAADPEGTGRCQPAPGTAEAGHEGSEVKRTGMEGGPGQGRKGLIDSLMQHWSVLWHLGSGPVLGGNIWQASRYSAQ